MDWLIGLLLVVVGGIIGFFAARYWFANHSDSAQMAAQVESSKQQLAAYRKDVVEHFETARQLANELNQTQEKLNHFLADSQTLLEQEKDWQQPLPFFAEDTMRQLRHASAENDSDHDKNDNGAPPRDYSEPGSGLFARDKHHEKS